MLLGKPNVYASIFRFEGQASVFAAKNGPCYRCLYAKPPPPGLVPSCAEGGVLGVLPGLLGVIQATEVVKLVVGVGEPLVGRLLLVVVFDERSSLGLVKLRSKQVSQQLAAMFDEIAAGDYDDLDSPFAGITDEDIDSLFS